MKSNTLPCRTTSRCGLTLLELVIVLVVLTALTGIAVQSLEPLADQSRYEATQLTLQNAEQAILSRDILNGQLSFSGFVADIGRLPFAREIDIAGDVTLELAARELWTNDLNGDSAADIVNYSFASYDDPFTDSTVRGGDINIPVAAGWRGPYLLFPPGSAELKDGYGQGIQFFSPELNTWVNGTITIDPSDPPSISGFRTISPGPDSNVLRMPSDVLTPADYVGAIEVSITLEEGQDIGDGSLFVRVYGPVNGLPHVLANINLTKSALPYTGTLGVDIPCGTRAIRALVVDSPDTTQSVPTPMPSTANPQGSENVEMSSYLHQMVIGPGINRIDLHLR
ncbi:MAG: hypothetical protein AAF802_12200 [Planctomycetota bacterium]